MTAAESSADGVDLGGAAERLLMWRTLFWTLTAGAAFSLVGTIAFPHQPGEVVVGLLTSAACLAAAGLLRLGSDRLPTWLAHVVIAGGTVAITFQVYTNVRASNDDEIFYLWVAIFAFYFFSRRQALAQLALVGAGYAIAILARGNTVPEDRMRWLVTIASLAVAGLVVHHLASRQRVMIARLTEAVRTDPLTGLLNRKGFGDALEAQLAGAQRRGASLGLIIGDLDRFKQVNDRLGHAAGDETLKAVSAVLEASTRGGERPARLGGEEFALIASDAGPKQALQAAERVRQGVGETFADEPVPVTISFGVAIYPDDGETADALILAADRALYRAKESGRDRSVLHRPADSQDRP